MLTNLAAIVFTTVVTNWTDVAKEVPIPESGIVFNTRYKQSGTIVTNTVAKIEWAGGFKELVLETKECPTRIERWDYRSQAVFYGYPAGSFTNRW